MNTPDDILARMAARAEKYCPLFGEHKMIPCVCGYPSEEQRAVRSLVTSNEVGSALPDLVGRRLSFEQTAALRARVAELEAQAKGHAEALVIAHAMGAASRNAEVWDHADLAMMYFRELKAVTMERDESRAALRDIGEIVGVSLSVDAEHAAYLSVVDEVRRDRETSWKAIDMENAARKEAESRLWDSQRLKDSYSSELKAVIAERDAATARVAELEAQANVRSQPTTSPGTTMSAATIFPFIEIRHRWSGRVLYSTTASRHLGAAVIEALLTGADLMGADLTGADLTGVNLKGADLTVANLAGADLTAANLRAANLRGADLRDANLIGADLTAADLRDANLIGAVLTAANLRDANLIGANLRGANLIGAVLTAAVLTGADLTAADLTVANLAVIRADVESVLDAAALEVSALLTALDAGKVDGSAYEGECACLVGTIAKARGCAVRDLAGSLRPDSGRPAERWFMGIGRGHTPSNNPVARITAEWIREWQAKQSTTVA